MIRWLRARTPGGVDGFTLLETLIALLLLGLVASLLASVTAEWLPNWRHALLRARSSEKAAIALDRLVIDLSAAQYVSVTRQNGAPLFDGDEQSVAFVRSAIGPNGSRGLEIVRISEMADDIGPALVRMRAPFKPYADAEHIPFGEPVVLLRAPLRVTFGFANSEGKWQKTWRNTGTLPIAVRFVVHNDDADRATLISTAARINIDMLAPKEIGETPAITASATHNTTGATQ